MSGSQTNTFDLSVHHLQFTLQARTLVHLGPQAGAQIRGALWEALQTFACTNPAARHDPDHVQYCPMCRLMNMEAGRSIRGINPARPFAIRPPLADRPGQDLLLYPDDTFTVGVNLFGDAVDSFPYLCQAFDQMGEHGVGYGRGRFTLRHIEAVNPLTGEEQPLMENRRIIAIPTCPVTAGQVGRAAAALPDDVIRLNFLTPARLTRQKGRLAIKPDFRSLIARLIERCQSLEYHYTDSPAPQPLWKERYLYLTDLAQQISTVRDDTWWVQIRSGSRRTNSTSAVGGFVGDVVFQGDLAPFREWLLWGQSLHVGKNAVKGSGWYIVRPESEK